MDKLIFKLKNLPAKPGVYQFLDKNGKVLYIGKAKNLRARVKQYFQKNDERPQIPFLMKEAEDVSYTVVNSELEALFLENTLIKQYLPKYNIDLRDDKNYAFIKIDYSTEIPTIGYARKIKLRPESTNLTRMTRKNNSDNSDGIRILGSRYFGPYSATHKIKQTLNLIRKIFPYCSAKKVSSRPCFYYYLHRCPGVCVGKISLADYRLYLNNIIAFLKGDFDGILNKLKADMAKAAKAKKFELAARLRDQLKSLTILTEKQNVILAKKVDWDIASLAFSDRYACVNLFKIRGGKMFDKENFIYELLDPNIRINPNDPNSDNSSNIRVFGPVLQRFLEQYYLEASSIPKTIYTQISAADGKLVSKIIKSRFKKSTAIISPQKGQAKKLISLGKLNAEEYLKNWLDDKVQNFDKINAALNQLKDVLKLNKIPRRIECYDISNIQGTNAVGSMVVFKDGLPTKAEYRKFKIQGKSSPDDFYMMREMLARRFSHSAIASEAKQSHPKKRLPRPSDALGARNDMWVLPDLIVIDGGKGQLSAALQTLQATSYKLLPVVGLAKRIEEIFLPGQNQPVILSHDQPALQLLQRLRDEAHRFGITFHRKLRSKQAVKSALDEIPGIGPKTKKLLKTTFGTVAEIRNVSVDELAKVVGKKLAEVIKKGL